MHKDAQGTAASRFGLIRWSHRTQFPKPPSQRGLHFTRQAGLTVHVSDRHIVFHRVLDLLFPIGRIPFWTIPCRETYATRAGRNATRSEILEGKGVEFARVLLNRDDIAIDKSAD